MARFAFRVDSDAEDFFSSILREMQLSFNMSEDEAVARINDRFAGLEIVGDNIIYHRSEEFWSKDIVYGHHSYWWNNEGNVEPLPSPGRAHRLLQRQWWWRRWWQYRRKWWTLKMRFRHRRLRNR